MDDVRAHPGQVLTVAVHTRQAVELGSTDLMLQYDPRAWEALSAESATLSGFTYAIDAHHGRFRLKQRGGRYAR